MGTDQLPLAKALGFTPSFFVAHVYHWGDIHLKNFGPDRASAISPAGTALALGLPFTFHQDAPVIPPDMLETVWCAVNRVTRSGAVLGPEQRIPVYEALRAVTANAAWQYFEENSKGTLAPGRPGDSGPGPHDRPAGAAPGNSSSVHHQGRKNHLRGISAHTRKKKRDSKWNSGRCI